MESEIRRFQEFELVDRRRSRPPVRLIHHIHSIHGIATIDPDQGLIEG
jgi:hypothetical protein